MGTCWLLCLHASNDFHKEVNEGTCWLVLLECKQRRIHRKNEKESPCVSLSGNLAHVKKGRKSQESETKKCVSCIIKRSRKIEKSEKRFCRRCEFE